MVPIRQTAGARRASVLRAAITEFAHAGYAGTSTEAIAARAGISQPYVFRLFGTKLDLFLATFEAVNRRILEAFDAAADGLGGEEAMAAMGRAYLDLLSDPELLQLELHGFAAAAGEPAIARACQEIFRQIARLVRQRTGAGPEKLREFLAQGMLWNVMAATDLLSVQEDWAQGLCPDDDEKRQIALSLTRGVPGNAAAAATPGPTTA
jgi:AcrR family transcriptional regulator